MVSGILIGAALLVLGSLFAWRSRRRGREGDESEPPSTDQGVLSTRAPRHDTALDELRAMREALKPAEHSRVERRRPAGGAPRPALGRRRKTAGPGPDASEP
jgi:hypothetical protein